MLSDIAEKFLNLKKAFLNREFSKLNDMQREAVFNINGPMVVLAGAGSGKTTAVINRIVNMVNYGNAYMDDSIGENIAQESIKILENMENEEKCKIVDLIKVNPVMPSNILAITFTNKAANELKNRISAALGDRAEEVCASTFHSLCARILRAYATKLGYSNHFTIYDEDDSVKIVKECMKTLNILPDEISPKAIKYLIARAKDNLISSEEYKEKYFQVYKLYQEKLIKADAMDFDDLIFNTVKLFKEFPEILEKYHQKFQYILVDEYQDTNYAQFVLIKILSNKNGNLCVVGDDDQSIYKFRGALIKNIIDFDKIFPGTKLIRFEQNYRSSKNIIQTANCVIKNNLERKGKVLWTNNEPGELIKVHTAFSEHDEANFIAEAIKDKVSRGEKLSDCAILYRKNSQSNVLEKILMRKGIPYRIFGGLRFYDRKEIRDMIAYLSVINNSMDEIRLRRIINQPRRSIGERTIAQASEISKETGKDLLSVMRECEKFEGLQRVSAKLKAFSNLIDELIYTYNNENISISKLYELLLEKTQYINFLKSERDGSETRIENVKELLNSIVSYEQLKGEDATLSGFLEEISLFSDIDNYDSSADVVALMTLHASKGLEFSNVFIPGFEEGIFPVSQVENNDEELEEERRLAYVGITRCKKSLYLLNSDSRMFAGSNLHNKASRFLDEIPAELIKKTKSRDWKNLEVGQSIPKSVQEQRIQSVMAARNFGGISGGKILKSMPKFQIGDKVGHKTFGEGIIESAIPSANDYILEINFNGNHKKLLANYSNLKKI